MVGLLWNGWPGCPGISGRNDPEYALKLNRITTATVEKHITDRQKEGMHIGTLRKVLVTLNQIFRYAVRHGCIDHNPLNDAERPRTQGREDDDKDIMVLTPEQIYKLLEKTEGQKYRALSMLAVLTGARQGELLGLKWLDGQRIEKVETRLSEERAGLGFPQ